MWPCCWWVVFLVIHCWALESKRAFFNSYFGQQVTQRAEDVEEIVSNLFSNKYNSNRGNVILSEYITPGEAEVIMHQYSVGEENEDKRLHIQRLIQKYGYPVEKHNAITEDGYILTLFRIPGKGPAIFLMHGLLGSADDFVTAGPESGIAYLLSSEGYDVWLGNARGNKHSRMHQQLSPDNADFWDFSWDEIGHYDLPAAIDYVLGVTNEKTLKYLGHSQGTTSFFVMASMRPEYNDKVSLMVALSAVAWLSHAKSPIVTILAPHHKKLHTILKAFGVYEFQPSNSVVRIIQNSVCGKSLLAELLCSNLVFLLCGFNRDQLNVTNLPVIYGHMPSGAATKQVAHYGQIATSGKFSKFDYGPDGNMQKYKTEDPPDYPVEKITTRVVIFAGGEDWLAAPEDVEILQSKLPNVELYKVKDKRFNHMDFLWAKDVKTLVFDKISKLFSSQNKK